MMSKHHDTSLPPDHRLAFGRLVGALVQAASRGDVPPCGRYGVSESWVSEDAEERAVAARACADCPVLTACAAVGEFEDSGVWGGLDREQTEQRRRRSRPRPARRLR